MDNPSVPPNTDPEAEALEDCNCTADSDDTMPDSVDCGWEGWEDEDESDRHWQDNDKGQDIDGCEGDVDK